MDLVVRRVMKVGLFIAFFLSNGKKKIQKKNGVKMSFYDRSGD
jgi:hypothetical protein